MRQRWRAWQRRGVAAEIPSSLPMVTAGLTHGLSLLADLFGGEGRAVAIPRPFWGNYRQTFAVRTGAEVRTAPAYVDGRYNTRAIAEALDGLPDGRARRGAPQPPVEPRRLLADRRRAAGGRASPSSAWRSGARWW